MTPAEALADASVSTSARDVLEDGEVVLLVARPSARLIPAFAAAPLLILLAAMLVVGGVRFFDILSAEKVDGMVLVLGGVAVLVVAVQVYRWRSRLYILTNRRVLQQTGIARVTVRQCLLANLAGVEVILFPPEHLTHLGSVCFQTRAGFAPELRWGNLARPEQIAAEIRKAIRHNHR